LLSIADDAAIVSAAALILGAIFVLIELRHMQKVRNVEISMKLFEWAQTERLLKAFRYIENEFRFEDYQKHKKGKEVPKPLTTFRRPPGSLSKWASWSRRSLWTLMS
jgi:hypothetical protein